jgi:translation initiation factor 2B subunit (eIF-2B alpha/beta/delta family)
MQNTLSSLLRDLEMEMGTHRMCIMTLDALKEALLNYRKQGHHHFKKSLYLILDLVSHTEPRFAILIDSIYKIMEMAESMNEDDSMADLCLEIDRISASYQLEKLHMVRNAEAIDMEGKNVLIYDHSHSVQDVLTAARNRGLQFNIIVAEQDLHKSADNIAFLHDHQIPYQVVPSYMLSHVDDMVDMAFFGGVTFQENHNFIMDPGSKSIISHLHLENKPIYIFMTTSKFSLWKLDSPSYEVYSKPHRRRHHHWEHIEYERLKFSHDRVASNLISHVVTEKAVYRPAQLIRLFNKLFQSRQQQKKRLTEEL